MMWGLFGLGYVASKLFGGCGLCIRVTIVNSPTTRSGAAGSARIAVLKTIVAVR